MSDTPGTDECTYPADAMGKMLVVHVDWAKHLERKNAALRKINTALRKEVARLNGQTQWKCSCGGTDCDGQAENAALRTENAALAKAFDRLGKKLDKQQDDSKRMDWLQNNEWYWNSKRRDLRKAVDKGMKNTQ